MKKILLVFCLLIVSSCTQTKENKPPKNLIKPDLMSEIMFDVILMKNIKKTGYAIKEKEAFLVDQYILNKYGVDSLQFQSSQDYYSKNPKEYIPIFKKVQAKLVRHRDSLQEVEIQRNTD